MNNYFPPITKNNDGIETYEPLSLQTQLVFNSIESNVTKMNPSACRAQLDQQYNEFKLRSIMSEHKKTITAISWCPDNPDLFASASADNLLIIWNVAERKAVARLDNTKGGWTVHSVHSVQVGRLEVMFHCVSSASTGVPNSVSWCLNSADGVAFVSQRGPLYIWVYGGSDPGVTVHKEAHSFLSDICLFRWHPNKKGKLVFGHTDGSLSIFQPGLLPFTDSIKLIAYSSYTTFIINTCFLS